MTAFRRLERPLAPNHKQVFAALRAADRPMSAYDLIDAVRPAGITAPPTVYRALNRLIEEGLAHRLESLNAFVACTQAHAPQAVVLFTICDQCGTATEIADDTLGGQLSARLTDTDFHMNGATVEVHGTCGPCTTTT